VLPRLVALVKDHADVICRHAMREIHQAAHLEQLRGLPQLGCRKLLQEITEDLGSCVAPGNHDWLLSRWREFGRLCFENSVPLHEAIHALHILKAKIIGFLDDQGLLQTSLELYSEKEFEHLLGRLVESLVYQVVCGYERAMLDAVHAMPVVCQILLPHRKKPDLVASGSEEVG